MKLDKYKCDECKKEYPKDNGKTFQKIIGKNLDASGNHYDLEFEDIDLCNNCITKIVLKYFNN